MNQAARDLKTPAHSAGECLGLCVAPLQQVYSHQQFFDIALALCLRNLIEFGIDGEILFHGQVDIAGQRLGNDTDGSPDRIGFARDVMTSDDGLPAGDRDQRRHHADERALAGAIWPQQAEDFSVGDLEGNAADRFEISVALHDVFDSDRRASFAGVHSTTNLLFGI